MSRESDSSSPNPPRPGADAYPSGTPPYGLPSDPAFSRAGQQANTPPPPEPPAEESRTETTLTTRIRINIPGSRPIPPVVVRSPLPGAEDGEGPGDPAGPSGPRHRSENASSPVIGVMDSAGGNTAMPPDLPPEWRTAGQGTPISPAPASPASSTEAAGSGEEGEGDSPSTWFAPRKKGAAPAPQPPAAQPPAAQPPTAPPPVTPLPYEQPVYQQQPYGPPEPQPLYQPPTQQQPPQQQPPAQQPPASRPTGMNSGLIARGADVPAALDALDTTIPLAVVRDPSLQEQGLFRDESPYQAPFQAPAAFQGQPQPQAPPGPAQPAPPRAPRPSPRGPGAGGPQAEAPARPRPTGPQADTAVGIPFGDGFAGGTGGAGAPPRREAPDAAPVAAGKAKPAAKRGGAAARGRKLLVSGIVLVVLVSGIGYGAGLMLNQADVPKGTTVLGTDIGGDTRDAAVHALDGTVGVLAAKPLDLVINGTTVQLKTAVAGLGIDTTATVQNVARHDYSPADVIGSLFGGEHPAAPVVLIDRDKLRSALQSLANRVSGSAKEGYVHFTADGTVVTVQPQTGKSLDVSTSVNLVVNAYQERAAGLPDRPITLPVTASEPRASAAALAAAAKSIGKWATRNTFTVKVQGSSASQLFGRKTFSKALTLRPDASGKVVPVFDLAKLQDAYGAIFDQAQTKHNGVLGPVTAQDVAAALTTLLSKPDGPRSITL